MRKRIILKSDLKMFDTNLLFCTKEDIIYIEEDNLKSYLYDLYNPAFTPRYNVLVKQAINEFKVLTADGMKLSEFAFRFYNWILKLHEEVNNGLDYKYMTWAKIFANYISLPYDDITVLKFLNDYCEEEEILLKDIVDVNDNSIKLIIDKVDIAVATVN